MKPGRLGGVCIYAWRCLGYRPHAAACNREGGGPFCGWWRQYSGHQPKAPAKRPP